MSFIDKIFSRLFEQSIIKHQLLENALENCRRRLSYLEEKNEKETLYQYRDYILKKYKVCFTLKNGKTLWKTLDWYRDDDIETDVLNRRQIKCDCGKVVLTRDIDFCEFLLQERKKVKVNENPTKYYIGSVWFSDKDIEELTKQKLMFVDKNYFLEEEIIKLKKENIKLNSEIRLLEEKFKLIVKNEGN